MIPPILHQTWKTDRIPDEFQAWGESWDRHNPGWTRMFWNDRALIEFVGKHYPDFLPTFCSYKNGVMRADAGRYLLLHHFGGVYADIDCECVAPFSPIMTENRVVLCKEPTSHFPDTAAFRGLPYLLFNGTMASPPGHPFWPHLLSYLPGLARSKDALDATGPAVLTSAQLSFPDQASLAIHPSSLFAPLDRDGRREDGDASRRCRRPVRASLGGNVVDGAEENLVECFPARALSRPVSADTRKTIRLQRCKAPRRRRGSRQATASWRESRRVGAGPRRSRTHWSFSFSDPVSRPP